MTETIHGAAATTAIVTRLARTPGPDPRRRALVLALASDVAYGIRGARRAAATEAIRDAEAAGPAADASLHRALLNLMQAKVTAGDGLDHELLDRAERLESRGHLGRLHDSADLHRGVWSRYTDDLDTARAALGRCIDRARDAADDFVLATVPGYLAATEELAGDYAAAGRRSPPPTQRLPGTTGRRCPGPPSPAASCSSRRGTWTVRWRWPSGACPIPPSSRPRPGSWAAWSAAGSAPGGTTQRVPSAQFERAAAGADDCEFADPRRPPGAGQRWRSRTWRRASGRRPAHLGLAAGIGGRLLRPGLTGAPAGSTPRPPPRRATWTRRASRRSGGAAYESAPLRPELARSLLILGQVERRRKARRQSRTALSRARDLAIEMGHRSLQARVERELPRVAPGRSGHELTATEQRVAGLIAAGATNREAASTLFVSVRTVETHVAAIYRKLGVRTRAELARRFPTTSARTRLRSPTDTALPGRPRPGRSPCARRICRGPDVRSVSTYHTTASRRRVRP